MPNGGPPVWRPALLAALALATAYYGALTVQRNAQWQSNQTVLEAAIEDFPASPSPHLSLGDLWRERGDCARALPYYEQAARLVPVFATPVEKALPCLDPAAARDWIDRFEDAGGSLTPAMAR